MPDSFPRRRWLAGFLGGGIAATLVALLYPVIRFLRPRAATNSGALEMVAPYKMDELLRAEKTGVWPPPFNFGGKPCLLILVDGEPRAINAVCTHVQCTVEYRPASKDIFCNCHNGVYDLNGRNVAGPPPRPLEVYQTAKGSGQPGQEEIIVSRKA